jgi:hypothetical protein
LQVLPRLPLTVEGFADASHRRVPPDHHGRHCNPGNPETETVTSYVGAVINSTVLLPTVTHWTFEVTAIGTIEVIRVGCRPGPRFRRARRPAAC